MEAKDYGLQYLSGKTVEIDRVKIYPLTLSEIAEIGEMEYQQYLNVLTFDEDQLGIENSKEFSTFEMILSNLYHSNNEITSMIIEAFKIFFKSEISIDAQLKHIVLDEEAGIRLTLENYESVKTVLLEMNCKNYVAEKEKHNPKGSKAREILEKMKSGREKLASMKKDNSLSLADLISIYSTHNQKTDIVDVWRYTFYQFNDQFQRLRMFDNLLLANQINIQALINGGKDIKFEDYMKKLK